MLKITFDTNVFTRFLDLQKCSEEHKSDYEKILQAIKTKVIKGYFSDTFVTLEGVMRNNRKEIFGSTRLVSRKSSPAPNVINIHVGPSMNKPNIHKYHLQTVTSLLELGLWGLKGSGYLSHDFLDSLNIKFCEPIAIETLVSYIDKMDVVESAIECKNQDTGKSVGKCRARNLGLEQLLQHNLMGKALWEEGLNFCDPKKVAEAISEWADAESIIRHIGYSNDYFCTSDKGKSTKGASIFDDDHKQWLTTEFGVKFITPDELAELVSHNSALHHIVIAH
jgi:hypothetical protein